MSLVYSRFPFFGWPTSSVGKGYSPDVIGGKLRAENHRGQESGEMLSQEILHCFAKGHFAFLTCKNVSFVGHFNVLNGFAIALKSGNHLI